MPAFEWPSLGAAYGVGGAQCLLIMSFHKKGLLFASLILLSIPAVSFAKATEMDKCMDAVYLATGIGGGYHRQFDGGHTLYGATKCAALLKNTTVMDRIVELSKGLYKDFVTPQGLPLVTLKKMRIERLRGPLSRFGLSTRTIYNLNSFTPLKLGITVLTAVAITYGWSSVDELDKFNVVTEAFIITGVLGLNIATLNLVGIVASIIYTAEFLMREGVWRILSRLTVANVAQFFKEVVRRGVRGIASITENLREAVTFGRWVRKVF